jgi:hypothetical protein
VPDFVPTQPFHNCENSVFRWVDDPWDNLKVKINEKVPFIPEPLLSEMRKAVLLRNQTVHSGVAKIDDDALDSILTTVKDLLYFLDMLTGESQLWASNFLSRQVSDAFK